MTKLSHEQAGALMRTEAFVLTLQERTESEGKIPAIQVALAREAKAAIAARAASGDKGLKYRIARSRLSSAFQLYLVAFGETVATYLPEEAPESSTC